MKLKKIGWYKKSSIISITLLHTKGIMKTITLKTQDDFFAQINKMALDAHLSKSALIRKSKSALIRKAITAYQKQIKNREMTKRMQRDSLRARGVDDELIKDFEAIDDEYLLPPWKAKN